MNKTSLPRALLLAGLMAAAGVAQAVDTYDSPQRAGEFSTMTDGVPNRLTTNSPYGDNNVVVDTTLLGAAPAVVATTPSSSVVTTTTYVSPVVTYSYVLPAPIVSNADTVVVHPLPGTSSVYSTVTPPYYIVY